MFPDLATGQLCGFLFLFILITSVLSKALEGAPLEPENVPASLSSVAEGDRKYRVSVVLDLVSHVSIIALAGLMYVTFSPYNRSLALIGTLWRVAEGTIIALNEANNILLMNVAQKFISTTGSDASVLETIGHTLIQAESLGLKIGLAFLALGHLLYAILFISSGVVPSALGWFGIIASVLATGGIGLNLVNPNISMASFVILIPYEAVLGFWLLIRGGQIGA